MYHRFFKPMYACKLQMHPGMRPGNGNMFFNRAPGAHNMLANAGNCMSGNNSTMMGNAPGNGYFPPVNPGQTDLPSVSPRTEKSNIRKLKYISHTVKAIDFIIR